MSQANVIDFVARQREDGPERLPAEDGTVLSVVPIPALDATLVIVAHVVPLGGDQEPLATADVSPASPAVHDMGLSVDRATRMVLVDGEEVELTYREFELLDYLSSAPGRVYNRRQLLAAVWDRYTDEGARTVDVHVLRLRRKLGRHADRIVTVRNVGYKYQQPRG